MIGMYEYDVSFETSNGRIQSQQTEHSIHDVIKKVRKDYPDAKMFRVLKKRKVPIAI